MSDLSSIQVFNGNPIPKTVFGEGSVCQLLDYIAELGQFPLLVTGGRSFVESAAWEQLTIKLKALGVPYQHFRVVGEPDVEMIDGALNKLRQSPIDLVVGIGGGSAVDTAKALAGMLPVKGSIADFLEGLPGQQPYKGLPLPVIAVPTTAGTGSEATKNAVITVYGQQAAKRSFRHEGLVPKLALIDPVLLGSCPASVMLANAMDAFTQLLESYLSVKANPFCDAVVLDALLRFVQHFDPKSPDKIETHSTLAYAAHISGISLAQTGLGSVHGIAAPLGAQLKIPHGIACGTTLAAATEVNIKALRERAQVSEALKRYTQVSHLFGLDSPDELVERLWQWRAESNIPGLGDFGLKLDLIPSIVSNSKGNSMKTNPVELTDEEIHQILEMSL